MTSAETKLPGGAHPHNAHFPNTMNTEHTPGPWNPAGPISTHIIDSRGIMVADVPHFREMTRKEGFANRDLIAAAPELLEVLKTLADYPIAGGYALGPCITECDMKEIRAAIAKAEGKA